MAKKDTVKKEVAKKVTAKKYWFSDSAIDPDAFDPDMGLNALFRHQIVAMRDAFGLSTQDPGVEVSNGDWIEYTSGVTGTKVKVQVAFLEWNHWETRNTLNMANHYEKKRTFTPVFKIHLTLKTEKRAKVRRVHVREPNIFIRFLAAIKLIELFEVPTQQQEDEITFEHTIVFDDMVEVTFPPDFPRSAPNFFMPRKPPYLVSDGFEHNMYESGQLCIMSGATDWDSSEYDVTDLLFAGIDWILHFHSA